MNKVIAAIAITAASLGATAAFAESAVTESRARVTALWSGQPVWAGPDLSSVDPRRATTTASVGIRDVPVIGTVTFGAADIGAIEPNRRFGRDISR